MLVIFLNKIHSGICLKFGDCGDIHFENDSHFSYIFYYFKVRMMIFTCYRVFNNDKIWE